MDKKGEGEDAGPKKMPFFPAVTKWARYKGKDQHGEKAERFGNPYPHIDGVPHKKKRKIKDAEGNVIIKKRNIQAEPVRKGKYNSTYGHTINKYPEYISDGDERDKGKKIRENSKKWNLYYNSKRNGHFKSMRYPKSVFQSDRNLYDYERKPVKKTVRVIKKGDDEGPKKEPFIPSNPGKSGRLGTLGKFIRLLPQPKKRKVRVKRGKEDDGPPKQNFKPSRNYLSRPTPSITLHRSNLRAFVR